MTYFKDPKPDNRPILPPVYTQNPEPRGFDDEQDEEDETAFNNKLNVLNDL